MDGCHKINRYRPIFLITNSAETQKKRRRKNSKISHRRRRGEAGRECAYLKKRAVRYRTPECVWKLGPSRSVCQLADIGMRGLFIGTAKRQTFGGHLVLYGSPPRSRPSPLSSPKRCLEARARHLRGPWTRIDPWPIAREELIRDKHTCDMIGNVPCRNLYRPQKQTQITKYSFCLRRILLCTVQVLCLVFIRHSVQFKSSFNHRY